MLGRGRAALTQNWSCRGCLLGSPINSFRCGCAQSCDWLSREPQLAASEAARRFGIRSFNVRG